MIRTGLVVKIGEFGMSQPLYDSDFYQLKGDDHEALPVRCMAPEAIIYGQLSIQGDDWSFGVNFLPVRCMAPEAIIYSQLSIQGDVWSFDVNFLIHKSYRNNTHYNIDNVTPFSSITLLLR